MTSNESNKGASSSGGHTGAGVDSKVACLFAVKQQYRQLNVSLNRTERAAKKYSFAQLVQCACFPLLDKSRQVLIDINADSNLSTQYEWILGKMSFAASFEQVAATSENRVMSRTTSAFELEVKVDKSNNKQAHLLLNLRQTSTSDPDYAKGVFLHCVADGALTVLHFEHVIDRRAQIMIELHSAAFELVTSPSSKLYLC